MWTNSSWFDCDKFRIFIHKLLLLLQKKKYISISISASYRSKSFLIFVIELSIFIIRFCSLFYSYRMSHICIFAAICNSLGNIKLNFECTMHSYRQWLMPNEFGLLWILGIRYIYFLTQDSSESNLQMKSCNELPTNQ